MIVKTPLGMQDVFCTIVNTSVFYEVPNVSSLKEEEVINTLSIYQLALIMKKDCRSRAKQRTFDENDYIDPPS